MNNPTEIEQKGDGDKMFFGFKPRYYFSLNGVNLKGEKAINKMRGLEPFITHVPVLETNKPFYCCSSDYIEGTYK
ncbi:hypothetical protein [Neobacillus vireti]|uniref:hypothetical protein n=1 Tax=Neobacillus vireti TaxID=220686 RepID=UPI002FFE49D2